MGKLFVVGIGPGNYDNITIGADWAMSESDVIVGYSVYVDLVKGVYPEKEFFTSPMTKEVLRCEKAIELAKEGKTVSLICSGDSGIYGMAALVYELVEKAGASIEIEVVPGITSASSGGALIGAPLTHDFSVISLSDRLTPWEKIEARLDAAAKADFAIAIYNPASKGRPDHLKRACEILRRTLPGDRACGIARKIGREGESCEVLTLEELMNAEVDMFCTVFIGNSDTRIINGKLVTPRGYRDV